MTDKPQYPWDLDLTDAKEAMITIMRDAATTAEEVEVYVQLGTMARLGWIEHVLRQQKTASIRRRKLAQRSRASAQTTRKDAQ